MSTGPRDEMSDAKRSQLKSQAQWQIVTQLTGDEPGEYAKYIKGYYHNFLKFKSALTTFLLFTRLSAKDRMFRGNIITIISMFLLVFPLLQVQVRRSQEISWPMQILTLSLTV